MVVSRCRDENATANRTNGHRDDHGQVANTTHSRRRSMNGLEVDREVVDGGKVASRKDKGKRRHDVVGALLGQLGRDHGPLALIPLQNNPRSDDGDKSNQESDNNGRIPGLGYATVLNGEEVRDSSTHDQHNTGKVHLQKLLLEGRLLRHGLLRRLEKEQDDTGRDSANRQVDVEAPSPRHIVRKRTAKKWSDDTSQAVGSADDAREGRATLRGRGEGDDGVCAGTETGCSDAGDGSSCDEGFGTGGGAADDGADLEDGNGDEEGGL